MAKFDVGNDSRTSKIIIIIILLLFISAIMVFLIFALRYKPSNSTTTGSTSTGDCSTPVPPVSVKVESFQTTKAKVTWKAVAGSNKYKIYVGTISDFNKQTAIDTFLTGNTEYIIENLILGRIYYFFVVSFNDCSTESGKSTTVSAIIDYPPVFRIQNRSNPNINLVVAGDLTNIITGPSCTNTGIDVNCAWNYSKGNNYITSDANQSNCIKTYPAILDNRVKYGSCGDTTYYNYVFARQWNYDPSTGSLCNPANPEGLNCIKAASLSNGQSTFRIPYDESPEMQWDIVSL